MEKESTLSGMPERDDCLKEREEIFHFVKPTPNETGKRRLPAKRQMTADITAN